MKTACIVLALGITAAHADSFDQKWRGRVVSDLTGWASMYDEDIWDARGHRFHADDVSCAMRVEPFNTVVIVKNLSNGMSVRCPVHDRGPHIANRVIDLSRGADRVIRCGGLCRVTVQREGYEHEGTR